MFRVGVIGRRRVGPPIVWASAGIWLIQKGGVGWAPSVLAWGFLVVSAIDNVLKPLIISQGSHLSFILGLLGVLGGVVAFGPGVRRGRPDAFEPFARTRACTATHSPCRNTRYEFIR